MSGKVTPKKASQAPDMEIGMVVDELIIIKKKIPVMTKIAEGLEAIVRSYLIGRRMNSVAGFRGVVSLDESGGISVISETLFEEGKTEF